MPQLTVDKLIEYLRDNVYLHKGEHDGCRIWAGAFHANNHPRIRWNGKVHYARRLIAQFTQPKFQPIHRVWTSCGDPRCVAFDHIRFGTQAEMLKVMSDRGILAYSLSEKLAVAKRRADSGAKLSIRNAQDVFQMRMEGKSYSQIGQHYGVSTSLVHGCVKCWIGLGLMGGLR